MDEVFHSKVVEAYKKVSLITDFVPTPDGLEAILVRNDYLFETNFSSERSDSGIESINEPWYVVDDTLLEAIFNCQLRDSQEITEIHKIKRRSNLQDNNIELETSTELAPLNDSFNSEMDTSSSSANSTLHGTETSASLEFLYDEAKFDHFLSTCIEKFDLLTQFTANGVCGFFMLVIRSIYGLYRLNFFFL